jgi:hypothetical protein
MAHQDVPVLLTHPSVAKALAIRVPKVVSGVSRRQTYCGRLQDIQAPLSLWNILRKMATRSVRASRADHGFMLANQRRQHHVVIRSLSQRAFYSSAGSVARSAYSTSHMFWAKLMQLRILGASSAASTVLGFNMMSSVGPAVGPVGGRWCELVAVLAAGGGGLIIALRPNRLSRPAALTSRPAWCRKGR